MVGKVLKKCLSALLYQQANFDWQGLMQRIIYEYKILLLNFGIELCILFLYLDTIISIN